MRQQGLAALLLLLAACSSSSPPPPPPPPPPAQATPQPAVTGSAAFAVVAVGDKLKAYIPEDDFSPDGRARLRVVDAAAQKNGTSGHLGEVDLGTEGRADAVAATGDVVVAVGAIFPFIWFIDPVTEQVTRQLPLPDTYGAWPISDGTRFMTGVVIDAPHRRAYVSVWSGFIVLDLDTRSIVDEILVAPSENFGFDPVRNWLVAPFYLCPAPDIATGRPPPCDSYLSPDGVTVIKDGLNVVDLATGKVSTYVDPTPGVDQASPLGLELDAAAVDPTGGRVIVPADGTFNTQVIDLGAATFDATAGTFTAAKVTLAAATTAVAVEQGSRLGIGMEERGPTVVLFDLPAITADGEPPHGTMPDLPWGAGPWVGHKDPHGAVAGVLDGNPVAWLINFDRTWLARVDLAAFDQLAQASPGGVSAADMASAVTYIFMYPAP